MNVRTCVSLAGALLLSTAAYAQTVTRDYDRSADFGKFKTYSWVRGTELEDPLNHKRIVSAIDAQLRAKGMRPAEADSTPDILVAYHAAIGRDLQVNGQGYRFGPNASARVASILIGTLAVDIIDASTRTIVWRAAATKDLDAGAGVEKRERNITKAVEKLFKQYPPSR